MYHDWLARFFPSPRNPAASRAGTQGQDVCLFRHLGGGALNLCATAPDPWPSKTDTGPERTNMTMAAASTNAQPASFSALRVALFAIAAVAVLATVLIVPQFLG